MEIKIEIDDKKERKDVEILCILDRSGSMSDIMEEAVAAFNTFIEEQKKVPGNAKVTLVAFDHLYEIVMNRVDIREVKPLLIDRVKPRGMTALNDAVGRAINSMETSKDVVCLIQTDGYENASQEYSTSNIKKLIEKKKTEGWDVSFIGAGINAFASGKSYGIDFTKCLDVDKTEEGMNQFRAFASATTTSYREGQ